MLYRKFKENKDISQLGFGAMRLPQNSADHADIDKKAAEEVIMCAYENGVNYYDTAYVYHRGCSEIVLGEILNNNHIRDKVYIADKLPLFNLDEPMDPYALLDEQLKRLGTDRIDFYLLHAMNGAKWDKLKKMDFYRFMDDVKKSGKIGALGFSFHDYFESYKTLLDEYDWDFNQIQFNFMDTEYQAGLKGLAYSAEKNVPVVIMEPLKGGQLAGIDDPKIIRMKEQYGLGDKTTAEICFNFIFDRPEVLTVLSGMNTVRQVSENAKTASMMHANAQPQNEKDFLNELKAYFISKDTIPCTACKYCMDECPKSIAIPEVFQVYNDSVMFESKDKNKSFLQDFHGNAFDCIECGNCAKVCPQNLDIPALIKQTTNYMMG